jgi:hypothetical protein
MTCLARACIKVVPVWQTQYHWTWFQFDPARALSAPGPVLVEAVVDPYEPPMPPKATLKQMAHLSESLARGTPERGRIALTVASDTVRELV